MAGLGCLVAAALTIGWAIYAAGWAVLLIPLPFILGAGLGALFDRLSRRRCLAAFRATFPQTDLLLVYTDSKAWKEYIEASWLPLWGQRAVVINRSRPWNKRGAAERLWKAFGGPRDHTPLAVYVPARGQPQAIRFYEAFRQHQKGRPTALREEEALLADILGTRPPRAT